MFTSKKKPTLPDCQTVIMFFSSSKYNSIRTCYSFLTICTFFLYFDITTFIIYIQLVLLLSIIYNTWFIFVFYFLHLFTDLLYTLIVSVVPHWNVKSIINFYRINSCSTLEFLIAKVKQVSISLTGIIGVTEKSAHSKCTLFSVTPPLYPFFICPSSDSFFTFAKNPGYLFN